MDSTAVSGREGAAGAVRPLGSLGLAADSTMARRVGAVALALIGLQAVFRAWAVFTGYFYEDDFRYIYDATTSNLDADYLFQDYNGHLMPGEFLLVWLLQHLAPMSFTPVAMVLLLMQVAASLTVWALVRELVGPRPGALVPLALYLFSPLTLGSYLWYAAALQSLPMQLTLAAGLLAHVRYLRRRRRLDAVAGVAVVAAGLVFWEKALLVVPVLAAVTVLFFTTGSAVRRVWTAVHGHWRLWVAYLVLCTAYLVVYVRLVDWQLRSRGGAGSTLELVREAILTGFVPALFGGPFTGFPTGLGIAADPPLSVQLVFLQVLLLVVAVTVVTHRAAWRAWALLALYVLFDCLLLASGRLDVLGPIIGRDTRYLADASVIAAVAVALALFPLDPDRSERPARFDASRALDRPVVTGLVLLAYVNACAITSVEMVRRWADTSAEPYVRTAQNDLRRLGDGVTLYDGQPPDQVLSKWFYTDFRVSRILAGLPENPRFDQPSSDLRVVDENGHLRRAELRVAVESGPGPDPQCGWPVRGGTTTTVDLPLDLYPWKWTVRIGYYAGLPTPGTLTLGDRSYPVEFQSGLHSLYVVHTGPVSDVRVSGVSADLTVCVPQVAVGQL